MIAEPSWYNQKVLENRENSLQNAPRDEQTNGGRGTKNQLGKNTHHATVSGDSTDWSAREPSRGAVTERVSLWDEEGRGWGVRGSAALANFLAEIITDQTILFSPPQQHQ